MIHSLQYRPAHGGYPGRRKLSRKEMAAIVAAQLRKGVDQARELTGAYIEYPYSFKLMTGDGHTTTHYTHHYETNPS